jgi:hypothetical protein
MCKINNNIKLTIIKMDMDMDINNDYKLNYTINDIEILLNMLVESRCENYNEWISVGLCLFNIDRQYLYIWRKWSQKSDKYENGSCESKWKSFKKDKDGLKIGSLLLWAKFDNTEQYDKFIKKKKLNHMIESKYPNDKLILGDTVIVSDKCKLTHLYNKECLIKGGHHIDMPCSMYVEIFDTYLTIKCRHTECFGKIYPCNHISMNKNETNIVFNGDININQGKDPELIEFQQINIYENKELNELVFNGLNGKPAQLAKIIYYFYNDIYNLGDDNSWYIYENHNWKNIGSKNMILRNQIGTKLIELYTKLLSYYRDNDYDKNKIKALKTVMGSFSETYQKNNILEELTELYFIKNNKNKDFIQKLD